MFVAVVKTQSGVVICDSAETARLTPSKVPLFTCKININKYKYIWIYTFYSFCPALYNTCETFFFGFPPSRSIIAAVFGTLWMKMYLGDSACYCHVFNFVWLLFFSFFFFLFFLCPGVSGEKKYLPFLGRCRQSVTCWVQHLQGCPVGCKTVFRIYWNSLISLVHFMEICGCSTWNSSSLHTYAYKHTHTQYTQTHTSTSTPRAYGPSVACPRRRCRPWRKWCFD